jgi:serine/threonine protein kinase
MHYAFQTDSKLHLILDYVNGGELFTHLYQREHFMEHEVRIYIAEIVLALEQLHKVCWLLFLFVVFFFNESSSLSFYVCS